MKTLRLILAAFALATAAAACADAVSPVAPKPSRPLESGYIGSGNLTDTVPGRQNGSGN